MFSRDIGKWYWLLLTGFLKIFTVTIVLGISRIPTPITFIIMTEEQKKNIEKDIDRLIPMLARNNRVYSDEVIAVILEHLKQ